MLNMRYILMGFQVVLGLRINPTKSKLVRLESTSDSKRITSALGCRDKNLPLGTSFKKFRT